MNIGIACLFLPRLDKASPWYSNIVFIVLYRCLNIVCNEFHHTQRYDGLLLDFSKDECNFRIKSKHYTKRNMFLSTHLRKEMQFNDNNINNNADTANTKLINQRLLWALHYYLEKPANFNP